MSPLRTVLLAGAATLALSAPAQAFKAQEVTIGSGDGTPLAGTLLVPAAPAPAGGWPAVVFMHGLGGTRAQAIAIAEQMRVAGEEYVVLGLDARGHGASGGLIGLAGPNEVGDMRAVFAWLRDRLDVSDTRIGVFGISYGGGQALNSLVAGVPWAALETCIGWTDLASALTPQGLAKTGVIAGFLASLNPDRVDPALAAARDAAFAGNRSGVAGFAGARSSLRGLGTVKAPVFLMQGRRDVAFGLEQGLGGWSKLAGPKRLWIGNIGHGMSSFPGPDTASMLADGKRWFDRFLRDARNGVEAGPAVTIAAQGTKRLTQLAALPATKLVRGTTDAAATIGPDGRVVARFEPLAAPLEVFGAPTITVQATARGGWSRLVAVLTAVKGKKTTVIASGGVPVPQGRGTYAIRLLSQATHVPKGATLTVTLGDSTTAQSPDNLVYLDLPMPASSKLTVGRVVFSAPALVRPVSG